jgi:hypothetical protein
VSHRHSYVFDEKRIDVSVFRKEAMKRATPDPIRPDVELDETLIHFHNKNNPCKNVMHEKFVPDGNGGVETKVFASVHDQEIL